MFILLFSVSLVSLGQAYTGSNTDIAYTSSATASSYNTGFEPDKAIDGSNTTWCEIPNAGAGQFKIDLGVPSNVDGYGVYFPNAGELPAAYTVWGSTDDVNWDLLDTRSVTVPDTLSNDITLTSYRYIRLDMTGGDALYSIAQFFVYGVLTSAPETPLATSATNITTTSFRANWNKSPSAEGYYLDVATDIDFTSYFSFFENYDAGFNLYKIVNNLTPGETYYYRVRAYNSVGSSESSNKVTVTTIKYSQTITFNTLAPKTYGEADFTITATASSGLPVTLTSSDETVATISGNTVTIVGAGTTTITATQEGNFEYYPATPVLHDLEVFIKDLTVTGAVAASKVYDGNTDATLSGAALAGVVGADDVILENAVSGVFAQSGVGTGIAVATAMTVSGADVGNYSLTQPAGLTADITAKELTVSGASVVTKEYDGTADAVIAGATLVGAVGGDAVHLSGESAGTFAQSDVGTGIAVTTSMSLIGLDAGNYTLTAPTGLTGEITTKDLIVSAADKSREECGPNPEFTLTYTGFITAEDESALSQLPVATCTADETSGAGAYDITIAGGVATNYSLTYVNGTLTVTPDITDPVLTVQTDTITLDESGNGTVTAAAVVASATDNCGVADTTLSVTQVTTDDIGEVVIEVTVTDAAGNSASEFVVIIVEGSTGYRELSALEAQIYPNPTSGMVELKLSTFAEGLKVMDMTGKTILTRSNLKSQESIDLTQYTNGIYIFQIQQGDELIHIKVIKK